MQVIYQLRLDQKSIDAVQKATLTTKEYGLQQTHGLFGSPAWWDNIESGRLQQHTVSGVITKVFMAGHNDWPMCEVLSDDGKLSKWTRETQDSLSESVYRTEQGSKSITYFKGPNLTLPRLGAQKTNA
jgi:hypothetical protein